MEAFLYTTLLASHLKVLEFFPFFQLKHYILAGFFKENLRVWHLP